MAAPTSVVRIAIKAIDQTKAGFTTPIKNAKDLAGAMKKLAPAAAVAGAGVVAGFAAASKRLIDLRQEMAEFSDRIGIAIEDLSRLKFAAEQNGVSFETLKTSLQRMTRRISEASLGTGEAVKALNELGLSAEDLAKLKPEEQFREIAKAFDGIEDPGRRAAIAMKLFDTEGVKLLQILGGGSEGLERMAKQADELGITISNSSARGIQYLNEQLGILKNSINGVINQFLEGFLPQINKLRTESEKVGFPLLQKLANAAGKISGIIAVVYAQLFKIYKEVYDLVVDFIYFFSVKIKELYQIIGLLAKSIFYDVVNFITDLIRKGIDKVAAALAIMPGIAKKALGLSGLEGQLVKLKAAFSDAFSPEIIESTNNRLKESINNYSGDWKAWAEAAKADLGRIVELFKKIREKPIPLPPQQPKPKPRTEDETVTPFGPVVTPDISVAGLPTRETFQEFAQNYMAGMNDIQAIGIETFVGIESAMSSAFAGIIDGTMSAKEAFKSMGQNMLSVLASVISRLIVANILIKALGFFIPKPTNVITPGPVGGFPFTPSPVGDFPFGMAGITAVGHGGMTRVPKESTYLLDEGERVLSPRQNADLIEFMEASGTRPVNIMLDGSVLAKTITNLSDRGLIEIRPSVVI